MKPILFAAALLAAAPAAAQVGGAAAPAAPAQITVVDPQRLALARVTVDGVWPLGTYSRMMTRIMGDGAGGMMDSVLDMDPTEFGKAFDEAAGTKSPAARAAPRTTLRDEIRKSDPHFDERMRITTKVLGEEMGRIGGMIEPKLRDGLSKAVARKFSAAQLTDINRFLATDSGRAFGGEMVMLWIDPEVMKAVMASMPEMLKAMPAAMKRVEAATAHLPKPKGQADKKPDKQPK